MIEKTKLGPNGKIVNPPIKYDPLYSGWSGRSTSPHLITSFSIPEGTRVYYYPYEVDAITSEDKMFTEACSYNNTHYYFNEGDTRLMVYKDSILMK